ncbi:coiled-coil domain-containing protein 141 [Hypanus sabinus]|uniref:coiled-coil domain-containing protein 141 n=1 Tax=Hypanus sabinus TaxID=79690 RepID=UPI0028C4FF57|nr:coiled-coil domain-containing protein 141 [Hypanus sabinus]
MSSENNFGGRPSATTVSTVAVQIGDSRIVVAILKSGMCVELQLVESKPNLLEIGSNLDETKKLLNEHEILLVKLKAHEEGVKDLLHEADRTAEAHVDQSQLYDEMGKTLGENWKTLNQLLESRKKLLKMASEFFDQALEFAIKIDEAEDFLNSTQILDDLESLKQLLYDHQQLKKVLLTNSMDLLNKSQELITIIKEFKAPGSKMNSELIYGAHSSCMKIESLLEMLQDRRRQVEEQSYHQRLSLEKILQLYQWEQQVDEVTQWFQHHGETYLQNEQLGSSLTENEQLQQEHRELECKAKEFTSLVERLKGEADEMLLNAEITEKEQMGLQNQKMQLMCEEFWLLMKDRVVLLQEAYDFFRSANKGFDALGGIENKLKQLNTKTLSLPELSKEHKTLGLAIEDATSDALLKGEMLLNKADSQSFRAFGISEMIGYIQQRVDQLTGQCFADKELTSKKQQLTASFDDHFEKVSGYLQACRSQLSSKLEPGSCLSETKDVLKKYLELSDQAKVIANELKHIEDIIKQAEAFEVPEVISFSEKFITLNAEWKGLCWNLNARIDHLQYFMKFLKQAEEVEASMRSFEDCYQSLTVKDSEETIRSVLELADSKWQLVLKNFLILQDLAFNFKSTVNMKDESLDLNLKKSENVLESTIDRLDKRKLNLTEQWTSCQLHLSQIRSVKKQWKKFKEELKKAIHGLKMLEDDLVPKSNLELGCNLETIVKLQDKFNKAKPQIQQLNAEVEYRIKTAELWTLKGVSTKERNEKIMEFIKVHQQVKNKIKDYEMLLLLAIKFHHTTQELQDMMESGELEYPEILTIPDNSSQAKIQLRLHQENQAHVCHLYKLSLTLATDIISITQHSKSIQASVDSLQQKLEVLESGSALWSAKAHQQAEELEANLHYCTTKEEISELKECYKDLKRKFNNLKFSHLKKKEKFSNLKVIRTQVQQVEMYIERIENFKKKMLQCATKVSKALEICTNKAEVNPVGESLNELQRDLDELNKTVEEYKQNLDMTVHLQKAMEESQFWCEDTSGTVVRVGKYSSECKTKEAVAVLYKQFEKFVWPTVPQQEERIQQITEMAKQLYGPEEAKNIVKQMMTKHNEILDSIKELCNGLRDLESKLHNTTDSSGFTQSSPVDPDLQMTSQTMENHDQEELIEASSKSSVDLVQVVKESKALKLASERGSDHSHVLGLPTEDVQRVTDKLKISGEGGINNPCYVTILNHPFRMKLPQTKSDFPTKYFTETERRIFTLHLAENTQEHSKLSMEDVGNYSKVSKSNSSKECQVEEFENSGKLYSQSNQECQFSYRHEPLKVKSDGFMSNEITDSVAEDPNRQEAIELHHRSTDGSTVTEGDLQNELLADENLSIEEYECMSPDDISLPPLPDTPESTLLHSETEVDKTSRLSFHSLHAGSCSGQPQKQISCSRVMDTFENLAPLTPVDKINHPRPYSELECHHASDPNPSDKSCTKYRSESSSFIHSPLTIPAPRIVSNTLSHILKSQIVTSSSVCDSIHEAHERRLQTHDMHESLTNQESLHDSNGDCFRKEMNSNQNDLCVLPGSLTVPHNVQNIVHDADHRMDIVIHKEIRHTSRNVCNLACTNPTFSKMLSNVSVVEGSPVTLEIEVTGLPEPTLTWYKNGQKLTTDQHLKISQKEGKHILYIEKVSDKDAGTYVAQAKNSSGAVSSSAVLQVQGNCHLRCFHIDFIDWFTCLGVLCLIYTGLILIYILLTSRL